MKTNWLTLPIAGVILGHGHTPDLNKGLVYLYQQDNSDWKLLEHNCKFRLKLVPGTLELDRSYFEAT